MLDAIAGSRGSDAASPRGRKAPLARQASSSAAQQHYRSARRTAQDLLADDCPHLGAAIAYYSFFSLFPLLLGLVAILGFALGSTGVRDALIAWVTGYLPGSGDLVAANVLRVVTAREEIGAVAVLGFLWSATAVFGAVRKALNAAWDLERPRPLLKQKLLDLAMVGSVGALFVLSHAVSVHLQDRPVHQGRVVLGGPWRRPRRLALRARQESVRLECAGVWPL